MVLLAVKRPQPWSKIFTEVVISEFSRYDLPRQASSSRKGHRRPRYQHANVVAELYIKPVPISRRQVVLLSDTILECIGRSTSNPPSCSLFMVKCLNTRDIEDNVKRSRVCGEKVILMILT